MPMFSVLDYLKNSLTVLGGLTLMLNPNKSDTEKDEERE